jgi:NAD(P)-dependent dehydrogenase (short-subunit alcohol dehydrogenase family)
VSLHRAMAAHHGRDGIRVNAIVPGTVFQTPHPEELVFEWRVNDVFVTTFS